MKSHFEIDSKLQDYTLKKSSAKYSVLSCVFLILNVLFVVHSHRCCEALLVMWTLWQREIFRWPLGTIGSEQWLDLILGISTSVFFLEVDETLVTFFSCRKITFCIEKTDV